MGFVTLPVVITFYSRFVRSLSGLSYLLSVQTLRGLLILVLTDIHSLTSSLTVTCLKMGLWKYVFESLRYDVNGSFLVVNPSSTRFKRTDSTVYNVLSVDLMFHLVKLLNPSLSLITPDTTLSHSLRSHWSWYHRRLVLDGPWVSFLITTLDPSKERGLQKKDFIFLCVFIPNLTQRLRCPVTLFKRKGLRIDVLLNSVWVDSMTNKESYQLQ